MPWHTDSATGETWYDGFTIAAALGELPADTIVSVEVLFPGAAAEFAGEEEEEEEEDEEEPRADQPGKRYKRRLGIEGSDWLPFYEHGASAGWLRRELRGGAGRHFDQLASEIHGVEQAVATRYRIYLLGEWPAT